MKKRYVVYMTIALLVIIGIVGYFILHSYYSFATEQPTYNFPRKSDDSLRVMMFGDSWIAYHPDSLLLKKLCCNAMIVKEGYVGEKSKSLYLRLFEEENRRLVTTSPDYCVISAGINDVIAKMGPEFYVYHYELIIRLLLENDIKPVIIEIPDVGFGEVFRRESLTSQARHVISSWVTGSGMYNVESYRYALRKRLMDTHLVDSVLYVGRETWNPAGYMDSRGLYLDDAVHLNQKGYQVLDSCLATRILEDYKHQR
jgi:hypothetical protein